MLGKLIKHELIADARLFFPAYVAVLVVAAVGKFFTWLSTRQYIIDRASYSLSKIISWASSLLSVVYVLLFLGVIFLTIFYVIYRFYKNYFTDEGYLMLTLPAKTGTLVTSKFLTAVIWLIASALVTMLSIFITVGQSEAVQNLVKQIKETISLILTTNERLFEDYLGVPGGVFAIEVFIVLIFVGARFIVNWYFAIAFGQLISKEHKIAGAVISFLVFEMASQFLSIFFLRGSYNVANLFLHDLGTNTGHAMQAIVIGLMVYLILFTVALFVATCKIMRNKLNLD